VLRYIYRAIILIAIFVAALSYFSRDIKEVIFNIDNTTTMEDATFPLITIKSGDNRINLLHGYSSNLAANMLREAVTPLDPEQTFEVLIDSAGFDIKKLNYEIREFVGNALIETDSVSVFEEDGDVKSAKIKLKAELMREKEYAIKLTLITSKSKKMYFYHRIKIYEDAHLEEKLDFIINFHDCIMNKATAENMKMYLEPSEEADNSTLAYVNINSSYDLVSWGNLQPKILTEVIPTIKEIYSETASVELNYIAEAELSGTIERYRVVEFYRIRYSEDRIYLLNYERRMESIFDINLASVEKNELKLGITSDYEVPFMAGDDKLKLAFVRNRELWFYDLVNNEITKVFTFRQENTDYLRELHDQHDIRILNMDAEGNLDFLVYGYMNRGQYEGRVAVVLYHFVRAENRIEELVYIPVEESYQSLKENLSELSYVNSKNVFYFHIYNNIYSYDLITRELSDIATGINKDQVVVLKDLKYAAWQENADPKIAKKILIMNLESGDVQTINARTGYNIRLMDMINSNIIYGFVKEGDIASMMDGSIMAPLSEVEIASVDKNVLKKYSDSGYYISGLEVKDNIVELRRVRKVTENGRTAYVLAQADYIMNQVKTEPQIIDVTSRMTTEQASMEYYMTLPSGFVMEKLPKLLSTVSTVISHDPTVRLPVEEQGQLLYYPYVTGGIAGAYENAAAAIEVAKLRIGVVLDSKQQLIWERGVKSTKSTIGEFETLEWTASANETIESCLKLVLTHQGVSVKKEQLAINKGSAYDIFKKYSKNVPVRLTGITLDDALYYVSEGRPVIAMTDIGNAVVIYGYDAFNILMLDPAKNSVEKMGIQDSAQMFEDAGNVFLSYLEQ